MKLLTFEKNNEKKLGVKVNNVVVDIEAAAQEKGVNDIPLCVMEVIKGGTEAINQLDNFISSLETDGASYVLNEGDIRFGPCVTKPSKIICVGLNYKKHADETHAPYPETPILFNKFDNTLTGHKQDIAVPKTTEQLDYEVELGIVVGKESKEVSISEALGHAFGYFTANDLSARDLQFRTNQWLLGKTCDDFSPIGPYLVTADEVGNPNKLKLKTTVNGEVRQDSNTSDMIFPVDEVISYISDYMTLYPGDIILTGTPEGVVLGLPEEERVYIQPGDIVEVEIEKLGKLSNTFIAEK